MKKWKLLIWLLVIVVGSVSMGLYCGHKIGRRAGRWDGYNYLLERSELSSEPNEVIDWEQAASSWQYAAEHYAGICKWLLADKPIYGTIVMDANTTLRDCLIVSGSSEASVVIEGTNGYIVDNNFMTLDMDYVLSTTAIDPNEVVAIK